MNGRARWPVMFVFAVAGVALVRDLTVTPYDDGYFFKRFALNFMHHGVFAWNVADGPVHGITSQLFQLVAVPLTWIAPHHFVLASKLFLAACSCACGVLLARESVRIARRDAAALLAVVVLCSPPVLATMHTGMETALALLLVTWSLGWVGTERAQPGRAAAQTLLVYLCRPDAALIPVLAFVIAQARDRAGVLRYLALLLAGLAACLAALRAYYGTALPLPFYVKTFAFSPYGDAMVGAHAPVQAHVSDHVRGAGGAAALRRGTAHSPTGSGLDRRRRRVRRLPRDHEQRNHGLPRALLSACIDPAGVCRGAGMAGMDRAPLAARGGRARRDVARVARARLRPRLRRSGARGRA